MSPRTLIGSIVGGILLIVLLILSGSLMEWVDGSTIVRIQFPNGSVSWHTAPGPKLQLGGSITTYGKSGQIKFYADKIKDDAGKMIGWANDRRLQLQFNDSGRGWILGSVNYELPLDTINLDELHSFYPSQEALEERLIRPALNKSVFQTGQLMNSYESYKEKRSEMIQNVEDQMQNGVYLTRTIEQEVPDEFDPAIKKRVTIVQIRRNAAGIAERAEKGQLERFGVRAFNFAIEDLDYEDKVDQQIADQQRINMSVQTSRAQALQAEQQKLTATAQGQAEAEKVKWEQEARNSQVIAQAEGRKRAAQEDALSAEAEKRATLLRASAEAEARRLKMAADGALDAKLTTIQAINATWANAYANAKNPTVPSIVMGGNGGANGATNMQGLMELLTAKAAKDLAVDLSVK